MKRFLLVISIFTAGFCSSQDELTVMDAIQKALDNNYQIKLIKGNYRVSELQNSWGQAGMIPTFSLNVNNNTAIQDNTNNPATFFPGVVLSDNLQATVDMTWTIFSGFGIRINKRRFEKLQEQTKGNAIVVIESTIYDVILAYYTAVVQDMKLRVLEDLLQYSLKKLEYYQIKTDMGIGTSLDALEFENQVLTDSTNLLLQKLAFKNAKRNLNLIMSEDVDVEYKLVDSLEITSEAFAFEELKNKMMSNNQNLLNQYMNYELKELDVRTKKSAYYPVISLNLGSTPSVGYFELFGDQAFSSNTNSWVNTGNISIRYDLFQGMNRKRNVQMAQIQADMAFMEIEELKLQLSHQLTGNFDLYQTRSSVAKMSYLRLENANRLWDLGKDKYEMGLINVFNLNDIKLSYEQAVLNYYDRQFELLQAHYDILRITGAISQEYKVADQIPDQD